MSKHGCGDDMKKGHGAMGVSGFGTQHGFGGYHGQEDHDEKKHGAHNYGLNHEYGPGDECDRDCSHESKGSKKE